MKYTSRLLAVATCALIFASCTDDVSEEYSKMSGRTYIGAPEVSDIIPGFEKYQIKWSLNADPRINKARVSWADDTEFVLLNIERVEGENGKTLNVTLDNEGTDEKYHDSDIVLDKDTIYLKVNHVSEGAHLVNVTHLGENETSSLVKEMPVSVYGANYQSTLRERPVTNIVSNVNETTLTWSNRENCTGVKLTYTKHDGEEVTLDIPRSESVTKLPFAKSESTIRYYSYYLPVPSLDQISTAEPFEVEVPNIFVGREIASMMFTNDGAVINWSENDVYGIQNIRINYITVSSEEKTSDIKPEGNQTVISDAKPGSEFSYITSYKLPDSEDIIASEPVVLKFPYKEVLLDNLTLKILSMNGDASIQSNFNANRAIDGVKFTTNASSCYHTAEGNYMKTLTIDLGKEVELTEVILHQRGNESRLYGGNNLKVFNIYGTKDISSPDMNLTTTIEYNNAEYEVPDLSKYDVIMLNSTMTRPSGGDSNTDEDIAVGKTGNVIKMPSEVPTVRYVRIQFISSWGDERTWYAFSEIEFKGFVHE